MNLDNDLIKSLRYEKGWSQQQLADACQVSLRTVQRVERSGNASLDTMQGICAVFELTRSDIEIIATDPPAYIMPDWLKTLIVFLSGLALGYLFH